MKTVVMFCALVYCSSFAQAQSGPPSGGSGSSQPGINLSLPQLDAVFQTLAAGMAFRAVESAVGPAADWKFSMGFVTTLTSTKKLKETYPTADLPENVPNADLYFGLQMPAGFKTELGIVPNLDVNGNKLLKLGANIKWTPTGDLANFLPFNLAVRGAITKPTLAIVSGTSKVDFASTITGANLSVGKTFGLFEAYLGCGTIQQAGVLSGSGTVELFGSPTAITTKQELQHSSSSIYAGTLIRFGSYNLGLEFSRMFEIDNSSLKLGYEF